KPYPVQALPRATCFRPAAARSVEPRRCSATEVPSAAAVSRLRRRTPTSSDGCWRAIAVASVSTIAVGGDVAALCPAQIYQVREEALGLLKSRRQFGGLARPTACTADHLEGQAPHASRGWRPAELPDHESR